MTPDLLHPPGNPATLVPRPPTVSMAGCEGLNQFSAGAEPLPCPAPAWGRYRSMCAHEHERIAMLCLMHARRESVCAICYKIDGHECPLAPAELIGGPQS
jgi:hypothetical protein